MTKHMMKKATQHKVTTGTFLMVARFMGVLSRACAGGGSESSSESGTSPQARTHSINSDSLRDSDTQVALLCC